MLYVGLVLGIVAGNYTANLAGLDSARVLISMVLLTIPGLIGARLLYVAIYWRIYRRELGRIWRRTEGGSSLQGGLLLMVTTSVPLLGAMGIPFTRFWDVTMITMLIAMIFTKVGCLLNGCCGGRPTNGRFSLYLPDHRSVWHRRIPTQLLEAGLAGLILIAAVSFWNHRPFHGSVFLASLLAYSLGRFALQATREVQDKLGAVNVQQAICVVFGLMSLAGLLIGWLGIN